MHHLPTILPSDISISQISLGEGGNGKIFLAIWDSKKVAVKHSQSSLLNEAIILSRITPHPNIIIPYGVLMERNQISALVMEVGGIDLLNFIHARDMTDSIFWKITPQIREAVRYLHSEKRVVHRDLKPENVLIHGGETVKIIDFGSSRIIPEGQKHFPNDLYNPTPNYAAPEALNGIFGFEMDYYSLAATLHMMLKKRHLNPAPFTKLRSLPEKLQGLVEAMEPLILQGLSANPSDRLTFFNQLQPDSLLITKDYSKKSGPTECITIPESLIDYNPVNLSARLFTEAKRGDAASVKGYLRLKPELIFTKFERMDENTLLQIAVKSKNISLLCLLFTCLQHYNFEQQFSFLEIQNPQHKTAQMLAADTGDEHIIQLFEYAVQLIRQESYGLEKSWSLLHEAIHRGDLAFVQCLTINGKMNVHYRGHYEKSAMELALKCRNPNIPLFLEKWADPELGIPQRREAVWSGAAGGGP